MASPGGIRGRASPGGGGRTGADPCESPANKHLCPCPNAVSRSRDGQGGTAGSGATLPAMAGGDECLASAAPGDGGGCLASAGTGGGGVGGRRWPPIGGMGAGMPAVGSRGGLRPPVGGWLPGVGTSPWRLVSACSGGRGGGGRLAAAGGELHRVWADARRGELHLPPTICGEVAAAADSPGVGFMALGITSASAMAGGRWEAGSAGVGRVRGEMASGGARGCVLDAGAGGATGWERSHGLQGQTPVGGAADGAACKAWPRSGRVGGAAAGPAGRWRVLRPSLSGPAL